MNKTHTNIVIVVVIVVALGVTLGVVLADTPTVNNSSINNTTDTLSLGNSSANTNGIPVNTNGDINAPTHLTNTNTSTSVNINGTVVDLTPTATDLTDPQKKDIAMQLVSSAENSSLDWKAQYAYIEDIGDGRGYTGGIIGFTSGTHDMLAVVKLYDQQEPGNVLEKYIPALITVDGTNSHAGLDPTFVADWKTAAADPKFQQAQDFERDTVYFDPAVAQAKADGLRALGQFIYYDAMIMHGPGTDPASFSAIRANAMAVTKTPAQGGDETAYLNAYLDARKAAMLTEAAHHDTSRVDTEQRVFLQAGNLNLDLPLKWKTYGDSYSIPSNS